MTISTKTILIFCLIFILFHIWGAVLPSHYNWGTQSLAFFNPIVGVAVLILALIIIIPVTNRFILRFFDQAIQKVSNIHRIIIFVAAAIFLIFLVLEFPSKGLMLGDSKLILLTTPKVPSSVGESANYRNQPLTLFILHTAQSYLEKENSGDLRVVYKWIDLLAGIIFLIIIFIFVPYLRISPAEKFFLGLFLMAGGGCQFFFGYIENYALLYSFTAAYITTGWLAAQKKIHFAFPVILFVVILGLHLGSLVFFPTVLLILILSWKEKKVGIITIGSLAIVATIAIFYLSNYGIHDFIIRIREAFKYDFLPFFKKVPDIPYTVFSWLHIIAWTNLNLLVVPLGLIPSAILIITQRREIRNKNYGLLFFISAAICGIVFSLIINPALGMFRDWDLLTSFFLPLIFITAYLLAQNNIVSDRKKIIFVVTMLSVLHTTFQIAINADEQRHMKRAEILTNPLFMGSFAQKLYYDRLANAFWEREDYARAKIWYERYISIDSTNPRIDANLSDVYRKLNDSEGVFRMLKKSVAGGSKNPGAYSNFSVELYVRGDTLAAISMCEKALELNPQYASAHGNLGTYYLSKKNFLQAITHLETSIKLGMNRPNILRQTGDAYLGIGNYEKAINYYESYLRYQPDDTMGMKIVTKIKEEISLKRSKLKSKR